jgi:hypothetical protein
MYKILLFIILFSSNSYANNETPLFKDSSENPQDFFIEDQEATSLEAQQKEIEQLIITPEQERQLQELIARGGILFSEQKFLSALEIYDQALEIAKKYNQLIFQIEIIVNIANIYHYQEDNYLAISDFNKALLILKELENIEMYKKYFAYIYSRLAYLYYSSDPKLAKIYLEQAISSNIEYQKNASLVENYYNLTLINKKLGLLEESKKSQQEYLQYLPKVKNQKFFKLFASKEENKYRYYLDDSLNKDLIVGEYVEIQVLNKINGFTYIYEIRVGSKVKVSNIEIISRSCYKSSPQSLPENMGLFEINENNKDKVNKIFFGWMFTTNPSLSLMEHPIYDIKLLNCQIKNI